MLEEYRLFCMKKNGVLIYQSTRDNAILLKCLFIKHFLPHVFERLDIRKSIIETGLFDLSEEAMQKLGEMGTEKKATVSLGLLIRLSTSLSRDEIASFIHTYILSTDNNWNTLLAILMLDYNYNHSISETNGRKLHQKAGARIASVPEYEEHIERREMIANESIDNLKIENDNESIDRIMWNVIANGSSEKTNIVAFVQRIQHEVITAPLDIQKKKWDALFHDAFYSDLYKDNQTVIRLGINPFHPVFWGFRLVCSDEFQWIKLLDSYFHLPGHNKLTAEMIENINYVDMMIPRVFIATIKHIMKLQTQGNFNAEPSMSFFLRNTIRAAISLGYIKKATWVNELETELLFDAHKLSDMHELYPSSEWENKVLIIRGYFPKLKDSLEASRVRSENMAWFNCELDVLDSFIDYCEKLIDDKRVYRPEQSILKTELSVDSSSRNQNVVDELLRIADQTGTLPYPMIESNYKNGHLTPVEVRTILKWEERLHNHNH